MGLDRQLELDHAALAMFTALAVLAQDGEHVGVLGKHLGDQRPQPALRRAPLELGEQSSRHSVVAPRSRDFEAHLSARFVDGNEGGVADQLTARSYRHETHGVVPSGIRGPRGRPVDIGSSSEPAPVARLAVERAEEGIE